jgi:hypothetical protein
MNRNGGAHANPAWKGVTHSAWAPLQCAATRRPVRGLPPRAAERRRWPHPGTASPPPSMTETHPMNEPLSFVNPGPDSPWGTYLSQVDRVIPYLGHLARWAETLKRPKRTLIVDVPIEMDDGTVAHFEGYRVQHNLSARPGQGRRALPPGRHARRGDGAGGVDEHQERGGEPALRRRQGRHPRRPAPALAQGARAHDAPLHQRDRPHHRPAQRHPRARREHQRADHGVDDGHLLDERRRHRHRRRHRQAHPPRRLARPREGHRARRLRHRPRSRAPHRPAAGGCTRGGAGLWQRGLVGRRAVRAGGRRSLRRRTTPARSTTSRASTLPTSRPT